MKFSLGRIMATRNIATEKITNPLFSKEVNDAFQKYCNCDWGKTCEEDAQMNDEAVANNNDRILAVYDTCKGDIWIITEWNRSVTTILFPEEY